jgi:Xaa-Pro dipeptidase
VDEVLTADKLQSWLANHSSESSTILAIDKQVSDSAPSSTSAKVDTAHLRTAIEECRVVKDAYEIALIRRANQISSQAHRDCFKAIKTAKNERELEAIFVARCMREGCRKQAYDCICATGADGATLHYVRNDKDISEGTLNLLLDAGGEYKMYAADITRTFPINGRFSKESKDIYNIVLRMQMECYEMIRAGVMWEDVHARAHRVAIQGLLALGILHNGTLEEIFEARTSTAFFPHGLGKHFSAFGMK